jgi:hypothetical protein
MKYLSYVNSSINESIEKVLAGNKTERLIYKATSNSFKENVELEELYELSDECMKL